MPHERRHVVEWARDRRESLERRPEAALPVDDVLAPQPMQKVVVLERKRETLADVLPEPGIDGNGVAAPEHQFGAAAGEMLQHRVVLGDLDRVVGRDQRDGGAEDDPLGQRSDVRQERRRRRRDERRVVVLADREHVEADLVGATGDLPDRLDPLGLARRGAGHRVSRDVADGEDSELHRSPFP
jgi:hypothetical protein